MTPHTPAPDTEQLIKDTKLRIRHLFLNDSKCELCEKVTEEDGYDGQNEGCEKGLCIECAIHKALVEFSDIVARTATLAAYQKVEHSLDAGDFYNNQRWKYREVLESLRQSTTAQEEEK